MTNEKTELLIRRILVALDASAHSLAALDEAASLAASMEAELMGLFVEDMNLIRFASLPFARQVSYTTGEEEPLDTMRMERELKVRGEQTRKALAAAAERAQRPWSFRTVRGEVVAEILAAASGADLILLGKAGWSPLEPPALGSTALALVASAPGALLLVQCGAPIEGPIMAVYDGSPDCQRVLRTAVRLATSRKQRLTVLIVAEAPESAERLERAVKHIVDAGLKNLHIRKLYGMEPHRLAQAVQAEGDGLLVIGGAGHLTQPETIRALLHEIRNPILLVR